MGGSENRCGRFEEKSLALAGIRTPDRPVRSQVTTPTTQFQIHAVVTNQQTNTVSTFESGTVRTAEPF
jgi:hypothetical protein